MWHAKPLLFLILGIVAEHYCLIRYADLSAATHGLLPLSFATLATATLLLLLLSVLLRRRQRVAGVAVLLAVFCIGMLVMERQSHSLRYSHATHRYYEQPAEEGLTTRIATRAAAMRERLMEEYRGYGLEGEAFAIVAAMTLGDRSNVPTELREVYNVTGGAHVFALSGLHLSIIFMLLTLLMPTFRHPKLSIAMPLTLVWAYVLLVGPHASVVRAAVMMTLYGVGRILARHSRPVDVIAAAAVLMLIVKPHWLFDAGFQMSFLAVLSICTLYNGIFHALYNLIRYHSLIRKKQTIENLPDPTVEEGLPWHTRLLSFVIGLFSVSLAAQIGVAPLVAFYFHRFSCYFWITNFFVSPAAILIIGLSLMLLIASLLLPAALAGVTGAIAWTLKWTVTLQNMLLEWVATLPGASIEGIYISPVQLLIIYILISAAVLLIRRMYNVYLCEKLCKVN